MESELLKHYQSLAKFREQFGIARRVADSHVIHRLDDADSKKVRPNSIGNIYGKIRIALGSDPFGQNRPAVAAALSAGVVALLAYSLPYKLGLILAALVGIAVGTFLEGRKSSGETL